MQYDVASRLSRNGACSIHALPNSTITCYSSQHAKNEAAIHPLSSRQSQKRNGTSQVVSGNIVLAK
jgi:hypothetical protein